jgi:hypothetical protein
LRLTCFHLHPSHCPHNNLEAINKELPNAIQAMSKNIYSLVNRYYEPINRERDLVKYLVCKHPDSDEEFIEIVVNLLEQTFFAQKKRKNEVDLTKWRISDVGGTASGFFSQFLHPELFFNPLTNLPPAAERSQATMPRKKAA